jgi:hypothetical protein
MNFSRETDIARRISLKGDAKVCIESQKEDILAILLPIYWEPIMCQALY